MNPKELKAKLDTIIDRDPAFPKQIKDQWLVISKDIIDVPISDMDTEEILNDKLQQIFTALYGLRLFISEVTLVGMVSGEKIFKFLKNIGQNPYVFGESKSEYYVEIFLAEINKTGGVGFERAASTAMKEAGEGFASAVKAEIKSGSTKQTPVKKSEPTEPTIKLTGASALIPSDEKPTLRLGNVRVLLDVDGTSVRENSEMSADAITTTANTELFKALNRGRLTQLQIFSKADVDTSTTERGGVDTTGAGQITRKKLLDDLKGPAKQSQILPEKDREIKSEFQIKGFISHLDYGFREIQEYKDTGESFFYHALLPIYEQGATKPEEIVTTKVYQEARVIEERSRVQESVAVFHKYLHGRLFGQKGSSPIDGLCKEMKIEDSQTKTQLEVTMGKVFEKFSKNIEDIGKKQHELQKKYLEERNAINKEWAAKISALGLRPKPPTQEYSTKLEGINNEFSAKLQAFSDRLKKEGDKILLQGIIADIGGDHHLLNNSKVIAVMMDFIGIFDDYYKKNIKTKGHMAQLYFSPDYNPDIETTLGTLLVDDESDVISTVKGEFERSLWKSEQTFTALQVARSPKGGAEAEAVEYKSTMDTFIDDVLKKQYELFSFAQKGAIESVQALSPTRVKEIEGASKKLQTCIDDLKKRADKGKVPKLLTAQLINLTTQLLQNPSEANCKVFTAKIDQACSSLDVTQKKDIQSDVEKLKIFARDFAITARKSQQLMKVLNKEYAEFMAALEVAFKPIITMYGSGEKTGDLFKFTGLSGQKADLAMRIENLKKGEVEKGNISSQFVIELINLTAQLLKHPSKDNRNYYDKMVREIGVKYKVTTANDSAVDKIIVRTSKFAMDLEGIEISARLTPTVSHPQSGSLEQSHTGFFPTKRKLTPIALEAKREQPKSTLMRPMFCVLVDVDKTLLLTEGRADNAAYLNENLLRSLKGRKIVQFTGMDENAILSEVRSNPECTRLHLAEQFPFYGIDLCGVITSLDFGFIKGNLAERFQKGNSYNEIALPAYRDGRNKFRGELANGAQKENAVGQAAKAITGSKDFHDLVFISRESAAFEYWSTLEDVGANNKSRLESLLKEEKVEPTRDLMDGMKDIYVEAIRGNYFVASAQAELTNIQSTTLNKLKRLSENPSKKEVVDKIADELKVIKEKVGQYKKLIEGNPFDKPFAQKIIYEYIYKKYNDFLSQLKQMPADTNVAQELLKFKADMDKDLKALKEMDGTRFYKIILQGSELIEKKFPELVGPDREKIEGILVKQISDADKVVRKMVTTKENMARIAFNDEMLGHVVKPQTGKHPVKYVFAALCDDNATVFDPVIKIQQQLKPKEPLSTIHIKPDMKQDELKTLITQSFDVHMNSKLEKFYLVVNTIGKNSEKAENLEPIISAKQDLALHIDLLRSYANKGKVTSEFAAEVVDLTVQLLKNPTQENCEAYPEIMGEICLQLPKETDVAVSRDIAKVILYASELANAVRGLNEDLTAKNTQSQQPSTYQPH